MKTRLISFSALALILLAAACGQAPEAAGDPVPEAPEEPPEAVAMELAPVTEENAAARAAFAAVLETLLEERALPDGTAAEGDLSADRFAVCDVDGDGAEELILLHEADVMAGQTAYVLGWDRETGETHIQLTEFPDLTFYESGAVQAGWSHNQGKGGSFWPYTLYRYDGYRDLYTEVGSVDAWDQSQFPEDYPAASDPSGSGFVYYISTCGDVSWDDPVDESIYLGWRYPYVRGGRTLAPEYLPLNAEYVHLLES